MHKLSNGRRVCDRYVLLERIGAGGHGEIWRVYDELEARELALKILHPSIAGSPEAWTVLQHEFQMVKRLSHPGILHTEAPVRDGDFAALPMEFAAAGDLRRLRGHSYLRIVPVLVRIAEVLEHAHGRGVVHRDLKPGNVLFDARGGVRLADFGASGLAGSNDMLAAGSPFSASPQQLRNEPAATADDVYGLGALAYELLSGYAPFYPDFELRKVLQDPVPALSSLHPAPARLIELVMAMLAKDPRQRPASMAVVIEKLNATLSDTLGADEDLMQTLLLPVQGSLGDIAASTATAELPVLGLDTDSTLETPHIEQLAEPRIEPALHYTAPDEVPRIAYGSLSPPAPRRHSVRRPWLPWLAGGIGMALVIAAVPFVSRWRDSRPVPAPAPVAASSIAAAPPVTALVVDPTEALSAARDAYATALAALEKQQAGAWAGKPFAVAKAAGEAAERSAETGQLEEATKNYQAATQSLQAVAAAAPAALQRELAAGRAALAQGRALLARQNFERASRIDAANGDAQRGMRDAAALDQALNRMAEAARAEELTELPRALALYEEALQLAPGFPAAQANRDRLLGSVGADHHARAVAQGLQDVAGGKLDDARSAFEQARQLRPADPAARDGLARVEQALATQDFEAQRRSAADLEEAERWSDAAEDYQRALDVDPTLAFARAGLERSTARAQFGGHMEALIARPDRLGSNTVYADALNTLQHAREIPAPGPVLRSQVARLQILLEDFNRPVAVALESDNSTSISIARVGALGSFTRRELTLRPGTYTVIGTREGFRDVRRDIMLQPGQRGTVVSVQCTEPI
jgi:eukaryotic-like serine/threonine-protein kinase